MNKLIKNKAKRILTLKITNYLNESIKTFNKNYKKTLEEGLKNVNNDKDYENFINEMDEMNYRFIITLDKSDNELDYELYGSDDIFFKDNDKLYFDSYIYNNMEDKAYVINDIVDNVSDDYIKGYKKEMEEEIKEEIIYSLKNEYINYLTAFYSKNEAFFCDENIKDIASAFIEKGFNKVNLKNLKRVLKELV